jgi:glycosyltransferase involved in cell wall biosynthesis
MTEPATPPEKRPLRLLFINEFFHPENQGGTPAATSRLARGLVDRHSMSVSVLTRDNAYRDPAIKYPASENWEGVDIHRISAPDWSRYGVAKRFAGNLLFTLGCARAAMRLPRYDMLLVTSAPPTMPIAAILLRFFRRTPYAYLIYDLEPDRTVALGVKEKSALSVRVLRRWQTIWLRKAASVIAIGRCMRQVLIERYQVSPDKVKVVEVGAESGDLPASSKGTAFRKKMGFDGFILLYAGNFGQYHNFDTLLEAAEKLREQEKEFHIVLVGGGHKRQAVETEVERRRLTNITMLPFAPIDEYNDLLTSADAHLVTLDQGAEGLCVPSKFYSNLRSGRPVVALMSRNTEVAMAIEETCCGAVVPVGDADGLVAALRSMRLDPEETAAMGKRAREAFLQHYTMDLIVDKLYRGLSETVAP